MKRLLISCLVAFTLSCGYNSMTNDGVVTTKDNRPTLLVSNSGLYPLRVYAYYGNMKRFLASVFTGESSCVELPFKESNYNLVITSMEGEWVGPPFTPSDYAGWELKLGVMPKYDVLGLRQANKCVSRAELNK